ncbi:hypothetical protein [Actinoplanes couchii]|uniref:Integral membrane protein n=1 Tax=Actinoplanes couchii TaxID=403638 RepID=A0ABQ3X601_9ACTN|nr:hypothetical protein [Actinoplanes couchii]MDR6325352.1 hypothetical protein [Actinoplanes couchii]GID53945.1 hypothetical protein Aco03nite_023490 [Actinoplanes couchii]
MNGPLSSATIIAALVLAVWYLLRSALDRAPGRNDLIAAGVLSLLVLVLVAVAAIGLATGTEVADIGTFAGYLITTVAFVPTAGYLAVMEPTRWGSLTLGIGCLIIPVLVLRLQQIASVTGA